MFVSREIVHHFSSQYTCEKWIIGYNLDMDDGVKSNFGTHKELIVLKILQYKYYVNKSCDIFFFFFNLFIYFNKQQIKYK